MRWDSTEGLENHSFRHRPRLDEATRIQFFAGPWRTAFGCLGLKGQPYVLGGLSHGTLRGLRAGVKLVAQKKTYRSGKREEVEGC